MTRNSLRDLFWRFMPVLAMACIGIVVIVADAVRWNRLDQSFVAELASIIAVPFIAIIAGLVTRWASWQGKVLTMAIMMAAAFWLVYRVMHHTDARSLVVALAIAALNATNAAFYYIRNASPPRS